MSFFNQTPFPSPSSGLTDYELIKKLRRTRTDYADEERLHTFWVSSYTGGGGFRNTMVPTPPAPMWGRQAYDYAWINQSVGTVPPLLSGPARQSWSYLVAFRNEDQLTYNDRVMTSTYLNLIEPIVDVTNSYLVSEDAVRENMPVQLDDWKQNVDSCGRTIQQFAQETLLRGQLVGQCYTFVDLPAVTGQSMAESVNLGVRPRLFNLWPQDILDYDVDGENKLTAVKFVMYYEMPRASMLDDKRVIERIMIYYRDRWERYDIEETVGGPRVIDIQKGVNQFGFIPIVVYRWRVPVADGSSQKGMPQIANLAPLARALYNRMSEHELNLRQTNFAQLVLPGSPNDDSEIIDAGPGNALEEDEETKGITRYISPDGDVAEAYERRIAQLIADIYRNALVDKQDSAHPETSQSRAMRFMQTNAILASAATHLDEWEMGIYTIVGAAFRIEKQVLEEITIRRKKQYQIVDLAVNMATAVQAKELPIGARGLSRYMQRLYRSLVPDLGQREYEAIDLEIEEAVGKFQPKGDAPEQAPPLNPKMAPGVQEEFDHTGMGGDLNSSQPRIAKT